MNTASPPIAATKLVRRPCCSGGSKFYLEPPDVDEAIAYRVKGKRPDIHETGEIKRVITTLLLQIDDLPSYCVLVGATNHPELLDRATWRRFEIRLNLDAPTPKQLVRFFNDQLDTLEGQPGYTAKRLCESVNPVSFSEAEAFFLDVRRRIALAQGTRELRSILDDRVKAFSSRSGVNDIGGTDGGKTNPPVS